MKKEICCRLKLRCALLSNRRRAEVGISVIESPSCSSTFIEMLTLVTLATLANADVICPRHRTLMVETSLVFSSDLYKGLPPSSPPCTFSVKSVSGANLLVLVSTSSAFSFRQPLSSENLIIRDEHNSLVVDRKPKIYRLFSNSVVFEIPTNLNFRAVIVISVAVNCSEHHSFQCSRVCAFPESKNCSSVCVPRSLQCDSVDNCLTDEITCGNETDKHTSSSFRYHSILESSQLMLVGFFVLNGAFIVFFLVLSVCSVSGCFSRKYFQKKSRASRMTFVKYLREASAPVSSTTKTSPPSRIEEVPTAFSRINFAPSATLQEVEPEVEDRSMRAPKEEICSFPAYQPEIYIRRQSLPVVSYPNLALSKWKRTSIAH